MPPVLRKLPKPARRTTAAPVFGGSVGYKKRIGVKPLAGARRTILTSVYTVAADAKKRISLRSPMAKHYVVRVFSNGTYLLEPRYLVPASALSLRTLRRIEAAAENLKKGIVSEPIDLSEFASK